MIRETTVTVLESNRIQLPKQFVGQLEIQKGDTLIAVCDGKAITLTPGKVVPRR